MSQAQNTCTVSGAFLRIGRPTDNIDALLPFYRDGLGFDILGEFSAEGFDGIVLGHPNSRYHLEFTHKHNHEVGLAPTQDNLLIFYLPQQKEFTAAVERMENCGFMSVVSFNPYWDRYGKTFQDQDGYRVVLANRESPWVGPAAEGS